MQGIHQQHKRSRHKTAVISRRQENTQCGPQADPGLEIIKLVVGYSVRLWKTSDSIVEEPAPSQTKEEITDSLCASVMGTPITPRSSVPTGRNKKQFNKHISVATGMCTTIEETAGNNVFYVIHAEAI